MRLIALRVILTIVLAVCVFDIGYEIWEFFFEHDGVAFYAERPAMGVLVITVAVVSGVVWHLVLSRRPPKEIQSEDDA